MDRQRRASAVLGSLMAKFDGLEDPYVGLDRSLRTIYSNHAFEELVGYDRSRLLRQRPPFPYFDPDHESRTMEQLEALPVFEKLGVTGLRCRLRSASGRRFEALAVGDTIRFEGETMGWIAAVFDLSAGDDEVAVAAMAVQTRLSSLEEALRKAGAVLRKLGMASGGFEAPLSIHRETELDDLTVREREVLLLLVEGHRCDGIARALSISPNTVRNHLQRIFRKLDVRSQSELIQKFKPAEPPARRHPANR